MHSKLLKFVFTFLSLSLLSSTLLSCSSVVINNPKDPSEEEHQRQEEIVLNFKEKNISEGERFSLIATVTPLPAYLPTFRFTSSDKSIVSVDDNGIVEGLKKGSAKITVSTSGQKKLISSCMVTVGEGTVPPPQPPSPPPVVPTPTPPSPSGEEVPMTGLKIIGDTDAVVGSIYAYEVIVTPSNTTVGFTLHNSNHRDTEFSEDGKLKVLSRGNGKTTITVESDDGKFRDSITVRLHNRVDKVEILEKDLVVYVGESITLNAEVYPLGTENLGVWWVNASESMIDLEKNGYQCKVIGKKPGNARITLGSTDYNGANNMPAVTNVYTIKVLPNPNASLTLDENNLEMKVGDVATLKPKLHLSNEKLFFKSSNKEIVSIDEEGKFTCLKEGTVTLSVFTQGEKLKASCTVKVGPGPFIKLEKTELTLKVGDVSKVGATLQNAEGTLLYELSKEGIISVSEKGEIKALAKGEVTVTIYTEGKKLSATLKVVVEEKSAEPTT